jgi:hypothetical protein
LTATVRLVLLAMAPFAGGAGCQGWSGVNVETTHFLEEINH